MQHQFKTFFLLVFTLINTCDTLITTAIYRLSNIVIIPNYVVINSTSITNFQCIIRESNGLELEANLSKIIPSNQIKISTTILNQTAINIQLVSNNYVGIFHLSCHEKGQQARGTIADVIVKAAPGVLKRAEQCQVYDRKYIKCIIEAPTIATAIKNGYRPKIEFDEIYNPLDQRAYIGPPEFLENESTYEFLVYKWKPTVEGEFPDGVRMHMKQLLDYFEPSSYYFDMTPVFRIKPNIILKALSSSKIQINLTTLSPSAYCEKSIIPSLTSTNNKTWTVIEEQRNSILKDNLVSNTMYRVCIKCRQFHSDPEGLEECQEVKTLPPYTIWRLITFVLVICFAIILIALIIFVIMTRRDPYVPVIVLNENKGSQQSTPGNHYALDPTHDSRDRTHDSRSNISIQSDRESSTPVLTDGQTSIECTEGYLPIVDIPTTLNAVFPPILPRFIN